LTEDATPAGISPSFLRFEFNNRELALFSIEERDLEAQLLAIKGVLCRNREADKAVAESIKELNEYIRRYSGNDDEYQMHIENQWVDALHDSVFHDAANSMSAVGMLAPFIESLFVSIFSYLRKHHPDAGAIAPSEPSDVRRIATETDFWDPHLVFDKGGRRTDLVKGIGQLATSIGLSEFLPHDYEKALTALFAYRNKMFHHGFEWPIEERQKFPKRIIDEGWPSEWFSKSTSDGKPWIFYMSQGFIDHCLTAVDEALEGFGKYLRDGKKAQLL